MKVVFMGTPEFAKKVLEKLYLSKHKILAVVCAVDKPSGRGKKLQMPPVKSFAIENNIPFFQFNKVSLEGVESLKSLNADIFITAAFGQILTKKVLEIAPKGVINVHASLLPAYRGAAPVQYALLKGETKTGITIMQTTLGIDEGDIILQKELDIKQEDNTQTLMDRLAPLGGDLLVEALNLIEKNKQIYIKQNNSIATFTKTLRKDKAFIDFSKNADEVVNFIRAYNPNPVAKFTLDSKLFKVFKARLSDKPVGGNKCGEVVCANKAGLFVACGDKVIEIEVLQAQNAKEMSAKQFLNGNKIEVGKILNG